MINLSRRGWKTLFRIVVALFCFSAVAALICTGIGDDYFIAKALEENEESENYVITLGTIYGEEFFEEDVDAGDVFLGIFALLIFLVLLASVIGLFNFWYWSRKLFLVAFVLGLLGQIPFLAYPSIIWGYTEVAFGIADYCTGAIIVMSFASPVADEFSGLQVVDAERKTTFSGDYNKIDV